MTHIIENKQQLLNFIKRINNDYFYNHTIDIYFCLNNGSKIITCDCVANLFISEIENNTCYIKDNTRKFIEFDFVNFIVNSINLIDTKIKFDYIKIEEY